jgi:multicomponent Na+:H+ antiporter subunit E
MSLVTRGTRRAGRLLAFAVWLARELVVANAQVAWDVVTPRDRVEAGIVELRLRSRTDAEIAAIANLVSLTPGTLTLAIRREPATIWVHGMYAPDAESFRRRLRRMEDHTLQALRLDDGGPDR